MEAGVDLQGICLYPIVDRPDWDNLLHYHNSGIFDLDPLKNRIPEPEYVEMILKCVDGVKDHENFFVKRKVSNAGDFQLQKRILR